MKDERLGLPSASKVARYKACNGSFRLEQGCDEIRTAQEIAWSESGTRIHDYLAGVIQAGDLTEKEQEIALKIGLQVSEAIERVFGEALPLLFKEKRLWLMKGRKKLLSGKSDLIAVSEEVGLVLDYKSSYGDQDDNAENEQIRTNIVLAAREFPVVKRWLGGIIAPLVHPELQPLVEYAPEDVAQAEMEMLDLIERLKDPKATTIAGLHCRWCPAVLKCESARMLLQTFRLINPDNEDDKELAYCLDLCEAAEPIIKRFKAHAKARLKAGRLIPGWLMGKPGSTRNITDPYAAFKILIENRFVDRETFLKDCISIGIGDIEKAVIKHTGLKQTEVRERVNNLLADVIEHKPKEASLERA